MTDTFPSVAWFQRLADRMAAQPEKYRRFGAMDLILVPRIVFPDGRFEQYRLAFRGQVCRSVERVQGDLATVAGRHAVVIEGDSRAWQEMVDSIRRHGGADREHTLNYLTLPDWPFRLLPLDEAEGQLDVDRFYRYIESLQEFFNEAVAVETRFAA